jgi:predicted dehydrogenase
MLAEFQNGALGSFESSRFATGRKNYNTFEIYGSDGAVTFNLERMNELEYFDNNDPEHAHGFRTILATESCHPYVSNWWPPGHIIGYEHAFTHAVADFLNAVAHEEPIKPDFSDGLECIRVLTAGLESAASGRRVEMTEVDAQTVAH